MRAVCIDAGFLIAYYDKKDNNHSKALDYFSQHLDIPESRLIIPWPILYEVVCTKLVKHEGKMKDMERDWKKFKVNDKLELLDDRDFREQALEECFSELKKESKHYRPLSLVDRIIRNVISSKEIGLLITFNQKDFYDVCERNNCYMVCAEAR